MPSAVATKVKFRPSHEGVGCGPTREFEREGKCQRAWSSAWKGGNGLERGEKKRGGEGEFWKKRSYPGVDDRESERGEIILPAGFSISLLGCSSVAAFNDRHRGGTPRATRQKARNDDEEGGGGREECSGRLN